MKILWRLIVGFLAVVGALTIVLVAYLYFVDPFGLKALLQPTLPSATNNEPAGTSGSYNLSPSQKLFLEKAGIDANSLPTTITPELEDCLVNAVGEERANQIKAGAVPTVTDLFKAKACLNN
ncbi:MAG: hypothetical protein UW06_C0020G0005 [Parcubacteria group bacterium GW2011_GWE1_43_8]|nr:MAG: hypothetical protein UW06_C0020G0005 [Parcubacteria group bacterium GW2011_GWE1_43_8]